MRGTKGQFEYTIHHPNGVVKTVTTFEHEDALETRNEMISKYPGCGIQTRVISLSCCPKVVGSKFPPKGMVIGG